MGSDTATAVTGTVKSPKKNRRNRQKAGHGTPSPAQTNPPASKRTGRESSSASAGSHTKIRAKKSNHVKPQPALALDYQLHSIRIFHNLNMSRNKGQTFQTDILRVLRNGWKREDGERKTKQCGFGRDGFGTGTCPGIM
eukprot:scaffold35930_cov55-Attheya_sp.AAC.1